MIRTWSILAMALVGCAPVQGDSFNYQSTLERNVRGLVLHGDGARGHAGMMGTNCPFETARGTVTGDYSLPDEGEKVVDSGDLIGVHTVLLTLGDDAHLLDKSTGTYRHETLNFPGLHDARLVDGGMVALQSAADGCLLSWTDSGDALEVPCGALETDPITGLAAVSTGGSVHLYDRLGQTSVLDGGLAALDPTGGHAYVAAENTVRGVDVHGSILWEREMGGEVLALTEAGASSAAAVFVGHPDGTGALVYLDGQTGDTRAAVGTPGLADDLEVSADGSTVAIVRDRQAHFYRLSGPWR